MNSLTPTQVTRAVDFMLASIRRRHPHVGEEVRGVLASSAERWEVGQLWEAADHLVVLTAPQDARWGPPEAFLHVLRPPGASMAQLELWRDEIHEALPESVSCRISAGQSDVLRFVRSLGLGVAKVGLSGGIDTMLKRLRQMPVTNLEAIGLRCETVRTMEHVRASSALRRAYFLAHPEHGWASGTLTEAQQQEIDDRVEAELERRLVGGVGIDFVLLHGDEVVAAFGFTTPYDSPVVGLSSSFNICIAPEWHRRGLGTFAYRTMIERAAELGVRTMHGATSNAGVMHIGEKLGREIDNLLLRRDQPWLDVEA